MKLILLTLALAAIAVTHCNAAGKEIKFYTDIPGMTACPADLPSNHRYGKNCCCHGGCCWSHCTRLPRWTGCLPEGGYWVKKPESKKGRPTYKAVMPVNCQGMNKECADDEFCMLSGVHEWGTLNYRCAKKLAPGSVCQDDSWCGTSTAECPTGHECVHKCENGRCIHDVKKILKERGDCCNPDSVEQECASGMECYQGLYECIAEDFEWEGVPDSYFDWERCKNEILGMK